MPDEPKKTDTDRFWDIVNDNGWNENEACQELVAWLESKPEMMAKCIAHFGGEPPIDEDIIDEPPQFVVVAGDVFVSPNPGDEAAWVKVFGPLDDKAAAEQIAERLKAAGRYNTCYAVKLHVDEDDVIDRDGNVVLAVGNPFDGVVLYGPYQQDDADMAGQLTGDDWWTVDLEPVEVLKLTVTAS